MVLHYIKCTLRQHVITSSKCYCSTLGNELNLHFTACAKFWLFNMHVHFLLTNIEQYSVQRISRQTNLFSFLTQMKFHKNWNHVVTLIIQNAASTSIRYRCSEGAWHLHFLPWRWRQKFLPRSFNLSMILYSVTSQKTVISAVKTSSLIKLQLP
jgi:hypothetical protein